MKLTTFELRNMAESLNKMVSVKMPIKASYWVSRLIAKIDNDCAASEKARIQLIQELGTPLEGQGHTISETTVVDGETVPNPNWATFQTRYTELMGVEIDIDLPSISLEQFGDIAIEPALLVPLAKLIKDLSEVAPAA